VGAFGLGHVLVLALCETGLRMGGNGRSGTGKGCCGGGRGALTVRIPEGDLEFSVTIRCVQWRGCDWGGESDAGFGVVLVYSTYRFGVRVLGIEGGSTDLALESGCFLWGWGGWRCLLGGCGMGGGGAPMRQCLLRLFWGEGLVAGDGRRGGLL
jgi:hypothetical protein